MMMRLFPSFCRQHVHPVEHYPGLLLETLRARRAAGARPGGAVLTPGQHKQRLLRARPFSRSRCSSSGRHDLFVKDSYLHMAHHGRPAARGVITGAWTTRSWTRSRSAGLAARRAGCFRSTAPATSALAMPSAPLADDKSTYPFVPKMILFTSGRADPRQRAYLQCKQPEDRVVMDRLPGAGGEGSCRLGRLRHADRTERSKAEVEAFRARIRANPANYMAAHAVALHLVPRRRPGHRAAPLWT